MLDSVEDMKLQDVDLASVPAEHLASLTSRVTSSFYIRNVSNFDMINILDNLKCTILGICEQSFDLRNNETSSEETRALVRAMESRVERVWLDMGVILDIMALTQYSGQGKCWWVTCIYSDTAERYGEELKSWAQRINWDVSEDETKDEFFRKEIDK